MKALLKNYHQSPRKVRLVADMIRGKSVADARAVLAFATQKSSPALSKLLDSAVANARGMGINADNLFVKTIAVNKGAVMRRFKPVARGRAAGIRSTMSIVTLELGELAKAAAKKAKTLKPKAAKATK